MKVLLDECIPVRLKRHLTEYDISTVVEAGWTGQKNGNLMRLAEENDFDAIFTVDKNLSFQQNYKEINLIIVVFDVVFNRIQDFIPLIPKLTSMLPQMIKGNVYVIK
jgi:hypothetical protein